MVVDTSKVVTNILTMAAKVNLEVKRVVRSQQRDSTTKAGATYKAATRILTTEKVTRVRITDSTASHPSRVAKESMGKEDAAKHPTITKKRMPTTTN